MKRQREFLNQSGMTMAKKQRRRSVGTLTASTIIPRPIALSAVQKRQVSRMINMKEEIKVFEWRYTTDDISTTPATTVLTAIPQGVQAANRLAGSIRVLGCKLNLHFAAGDAVNSVRACVWSYKTNSTNFAVTPNVLWNFGSSGVSVQPDSQYNWQNRKDYKVHYDNIMALSTAANPLEQVSVRVNVPSKHQAIDFTADNATGGTNHLCFSLVSDSAAATHPTITGTIRVFYTDA